MLIARRERASHWYRPTGEPVYEVPKADGTGMRPTTIRDAVKLGLFRSVTGVLSILGKPGLVNWQIEQGIVAALTLPRRPDENEHDFAKRALLDSEEQVIDAASAGTRLHDLASNFLTGQGHPTDAEEAKILSPFMAWCQSNVARCIYSEKVLVNPAYHYAGRIDAFVELKTGGYAVMDLKTQDVARDKKDLPKPEYYPEWPMQLAAYAQTEALQFWTPVNHGLYSLVLDRNRPGLFVKQWPPSAAYWESFRAACQLWEFLKGCCPGRKDAA